MSIVVRNETGKEPASGRLKFTVGQLSYSPKELPLEEPESAHADVVSADVSRESASAAAVSIDDVPREHCVHDNESRRNKRKRLKAAVTPAERLRAGHAFAVAQVTNSDGKRLPKILDALADQRGVSTRTLRRAYNQMDATGSVATKEGPAREQPVRRVIAPLVLAIVEQFGDDVSLDLLATLAQDQTGMGSKSTVSKILHPAGWTPGATRFIPLLSDKHKADRLSHAEEAIERAKTDAVDGTYVVIHIDEKWFYLIGKSRGWSNYRLKCVRRVVSKSNSAKEKVMFLAAFARPIPEKNFDGRIGVYAIEFERVQQRDSKYNKRGETVFDNVEMTRDDFILRVQQMCHDAVKKIGHFAKTIVIQMDSAGGHGGGRATFRDDAGMNLTCQLLQEWANKEFAGKLYTFKFEPQPSKSPDLNGCDLGLWNSFQVAANTVKLTLLFERDQCDYVLAGQEPGYARNQVDLGKMTVKTIRHELSRRKIEFVQTMKKPELVELMMRFEAERAHDAATEHNDAVNAGTCRRILRIVKPRDLLVRSVMAAWEHYVHPEALELIFQTLSVVHRVIVLQNGDNADTNTHHSRPEIGGRTEWEIARLQQIKDVFGERIKPKLPPPTGAIATALPDTETDEFRRAKALSEARRAAAWGRQDRQQRVPEQVVQPVPPQPSDWTSILHQARAWIPC